MAFKLARTETFKVRDIEIETTDDKGRIEKEVVHATYRRLDEAGLVSLEGKRNDHVCRAVLIDVEGIVGPDGDKVPYSGEYMEALLSIPPATFALAAAFWQASRVGRAKN